MSPSTITVPRKNLFFGGWSEQQFMLTGAVTLGVQRCMLKGAKVDQGRAKVSRAA